MDATVAYMFPGQGSQIFGYGADLFRKYSRLTRSATAILGYSIEDLCQHDRDGRLNRTEFTQPAMYVVNALSYAERCEASESAAPGWFIGHSLGEYNALQAAGVFDFETGLRLVMARAAAMARCDGGAMAAVLGCSEHELAATLQSEGLTDIEVANLNAPYQQVIAGSPADIDRARALLKARRLGAVRLTVSGAFHSRQMAGAAREFADAIADFDFREPVAPVIANLSARPYRASEVSRLLVAQIHRPVRWADSVRYLMARGVSNFVEVGPGDVLSRLVEAISRHDEGTARSAVSSDARERS